MGSVGYVYISPPFQKDVRGGQILGEIVMSDK